MESLLGKTIGNYQIVEKLGRGGMADVYKAYHPGLAVHRAMKVIRPDLAHDEGFNERFQREARAVAGLRHPNIVQVHDFGQHERLFYMVMELVEGENLRDRIRREGPIRPFSEALRIVELLADALGYAHDRGVLHRDVKPENVLLSTDGQVILADFGIAKMIASDDPKLTATGIGIGTPAYMAPELAVGSSEISPAADLYAVGVVLYETLTARAPFAADTPLAVLQRVIHDPVPPPRDFTADIPDALQGVVLKAMAKDPALRYPTAAAFIEASRQSLFGSAPGQAPQGGGAQVPPPPPPPSRGGLENHPTAPLDATLPVAEPRPSRSPILTWILSCLLLLALGSAAAALGWWWFTTRMERAEPDPVTAQDHREPNPAPDPRVPPPPIAATPEAAPQGPATPAVSPSAVPPTTVSKPSGGVQGTQGTAQAGSSKASAAEPTSELPRLERGLPKSDGAAATSEPLGPIFGGLMRFGDSAHGEVEPGDVIAFDLDVRRETTLYFDVVSASRRGTYTFYDPAGSVVFEQLGNDLGPLRLDQPGTYRLTVETEAGAPLAFEVRFNQVGDF